MDRVKAYVDGFNLYHGVKHKHGRKYLWLDLEALVAHLLKPAQTLVGRHSAELANVTNRVLRISDANIRQSQLPVEVVSESGVSLKRPAYWA